MSYLYINENGAQVGINHQRVTIHFENDLIKSIPIETLEGIVILGKSQITAQCTEKLLSKGISVSYFSKGGRYFGRLMSTGHVKADLQRVQSDLYDQEFALCFSKRIIDAKMRNQLVVMRRYAKSKNIEMKDCIKQVTCSIQKIKQCSTISEINGHEGTAAKYYFMGLSKCIDSEFEFKGRNRRPPQDPFNSLISLGYSILMNEIYNEVEIRGLNPYFGFMHRDSEKHPTLVSDLLEEWRAVIVDATVMSLINGHEIQKEMFNYEEDGCFVNKDGLNVFLKKFEKKLMTSVKYIYNVDYPVTFRRAIGMQVDSLAKAIREGNAELYHPVVIR